MEYVLNPVDVGAILLNAGTPYLAAPNQYVNEIEWLGKKVQILRFPVIGSTEYTSAVIQSIPNFVRSAGYGALADTLDALELDSNWFLSVFAGNVQVCAANFSGTADGYLRTKLEIPVPLDLSYAAVNLTTFSVLAPNTNSAISGYACDGPTIFSMVRVPNPGQTIFSLNFSGQIIAYRYKA